MMPDRARHPGEVPVLVEAQHVDRAAAFRLVGVLRRKIVIAVRERFFPMHPVQARFLGQEILLLEPVHLRETESPFSDEKPVVRPLHDEPRDGARGLDVLEGGDGAYIIVVAAVHDRRVELMESVLVRIAPVAHRLVARVTLGHRSSLFSAASMALPPCARISQAVVVISSRTSGLVLLVTTRGRLGASGWVGRAATGTAATPARNRLRLNSLALIVRLPSGLGDAISFQRACVKRRRGSRTSSTASRTGPCA